MKPIPDALTFLESVAGYSQYVGMATVPSANTPTRLAVIDPSYTIQSFPALLPKVTFEGEDTLSEKRYPTINGYWPHPNDRVVMLPAGNTHVIAGPINLFPTRGWVADMHTVGANETTSATGYTNLGTVGPTVSNIPLAPGQKAKITIQCSCFLDTSPAGARGRMSWACSGAEAFAASDTWAIVMSVPADYNVAARSWIFTATNGGLYTFQAKYNVTGAVTGNFTLRDLIVERSYS